jgi:triosephosphate isomerase
MASRAVLAIANWKMNKGLAEAVAYARALPALIRGVRGVEVVVAPAFVHIAPVAQALRGKRVAVTVAGQDCHSETKGAYTGSVSAGMLCDAGATVVILGHSERRRDFAEDETLLRAKLQAALDARLRPILCVGETLAERRRKTTHVVLKRQVEGALDGMADAALGGLVVAYEPVWAIGTGETATADQAEEAIAFIRGALERAIGASAAAGTAIVYGGSVTPENAAVVLAGANVDGALVGGASLDPESFAAIVRRLATIAAGRSVAPVGRAAYNRRSR